MSSHAQVVPYDCPVCGHHEERESWLVVDAADRPDLLDDLRAGRLRTFPCGGCGAEVTRTASFLVLPGEEPGEEVEPLFAPDPGADAWLTQQQLFASLVMAGLVRDQQPLPAVLPVSHELLPLVSGRSVAADLAAWRSGTWRADSIALQQYGEWLGEVARMRFALLVKDALGELIQVRGGADFEALVNRRPELLSDEADDMLRACQQIADEEAPPEFQRQVEYWRHVIRLCRRDGVAKTFSRTGDS